MVQIETQEDIGIRIETSEQHLDKSLPALWLYTIQEIQTLQERNRGIPMPWMRKGIFTPDRNCLRFAQDSFL